MLISRKGVQITDWHLEANSATVLPRKKQILASRGGVGIQRGSAATWVTMVLDLGRLRVVGKEEYREIFLGEARDFPRFVL
jgi:hypothetical protein